MMEDKCRMYDLIRTKSEALYPSDENEILGPTLPNLLVSSEDEPSNSDVPLQKIKEEPADEPTSMLEVSFECDETTSLHGSCKVESGKMNPKVTLEKLDDSLLKGKSTFSVNSSEIQALILRIPQKNNSYRNNEGEPLQEEMYFSNTKLQKIHLQAYVRENLCYSDVQLKTIFGENVLENLIPQRQSYTAEFKLNAIRIAEELGNRAAAREVNVDEKRIREWRKQKADLNEMPRTRRAGRRGPKAKWADLEEKLSQWTSDQLSRGRPISHVLIRWKAKEIANEEGILDFEGGQSWCSRFLRRSKLTVCGQ